MIRAAARTPSNPLEALGIGVAERLSRFDSLPGVVDGLLDLYDRHAVARWLYAWWRSSGERFSAALPTPIQQRVGIDALEAAEEHARIAARRVTARRRVTETRARLRIAGKTGRPGVDLRVVAEMSRDGRTGREIARALGCAESTVSAARCAARRAGLSTGATTGRPFRRDHAEVRRLLEAGVTWEGVQEQVGCSQRVVAAVRRAMRAEERG